MTPPDADLRSLAMNIVNQLADLWKVPVNVRQATNDQCDDFVMKLIKADRSHLVREIKTQIRNLKPLGALAQFGNRRDGFTEALSEVTTLLEGYKKGDPQ